MPALSSHLEEPGRRPRLQTIVFALKEIVPGEEITVEYLNSFEEDRTVWQCRAASCRKKIDQKTA